MWTSLIIYSVFASVVRKNSMQSYEKLYLVVGFLIPLIASIIPAFFNIYGYDQYFCWFHVENRYEEFWLKMGFFFIPLWILFIVNFVLSQITYRTLKNLEIEQRQLIIFKRLMLFPFIMVITGAFATADTIYFFAANQYLTWLDYIGIILLSFYGLFTAAAYGFNPIIRDRIISFFCKSESTQTPETNRDSQFSNFSARTIRQASVSSNNTQKLQKQLFQVNSSKRDTNLLFKLDYK